MTHLKLQKIRKGDYPPAHRLNVNVLLSNIMLTTSRPIATCLLVIFGSFGCVIRR